MKRIIAGMLIGIIMGATVFAAAAPRRPMQHVGFVELHTRKQVATIVLPWWIQEDGFCLNYVPTRRGAYLMVRPVHNESPACRRWQRAYNPR